MKNSKIDKQVLDFIYQNSSEHITSEEVRELIKYIKRLTHMTIDNTMLLKVQNPEYKYAAKKRDWFIFDKRNVKPNAKPLIIVENGIPIFVYALSDTKGRKFELDLNLPKCEEDWFYYYFENLIINMKSIGIDFKKQIPELGSAGHIRAVDEGMMLELICNEKEYLVKKTHDILVDDMLSDREVFATIVHELGHYFCGHIGNDEHSDFYVHFYQDEHLTQQEEEFEAECVSYIVCSRNRIIFDSSKYFWTYLDENKQISKRSIKRILDAAVEVEKMLYGIHEPINGYINTSYMEERTSCHKSFIDRLYGAEERMKPQNNSLL